MTAINWQEHPLGKQHDRKDFDCGDADLNIYLQRYARQNHEAGSAKCFVSVAVEAPAIILGFYTLSPASIEFSRTPAILTKGLGRYDVPVFRLGRLAVANGIQGRGLGAALLFRAADRCLRVASEIGGVAMLIDAKDDRVATWYQRHGATRLNDSSLSLVLPLAVAADARLRGNV